MGESRDVRWELVPVDWVELVQALLPIAAASSPLEGLDIFSGQKGVVKAMMRSGMAAMTFEKLDGGLWEDVLSLQGLSYLFFYLPPCARARARGHGPSVQVLDLFDLVTHKTDTGQSGRFINVLDRSGG